MKGVMIPDVSAGSNHVGASEMWTGQVICPAGASVARPGETATATRTRTSNETKRPRTYFMGSLPILAFLLARAFSLHRLCSTPDHCQERRSVLGRHGVHATVRPVVHVAGGHRAGFVRVGALDDEDQLVAHVTMTRERGAGLHARQDRAALARLVFPDPLLAYARARVDPGQIAQREDLRRRPALPLRQGLDAAGDDRGPRRAVRRRDGWE